jgi:hypothetical protein
MPKLLRSTLKSSKKAGSSLSQSRDSIESGLLSDTYILSALLAFFMIDGLEGDCVVGWGALERGPSWNC